MAGKTGEKIARAGKAPEPQMTEEMILSALAGQKSTAFPAHAGRKTAHADAGRRDARDAPSAPLKVLPGQVCLSFAQSKDEPELNSVSLTSVLGRIANGTWKKEVEAVRAEHDPAKRRKLKLKTLPIVCNATYRGTRQRADRHTLAGFKVGDADLKDNPNADFDAAFARAKRHPSVIAAFRSPSRGLKVLIRVDNDLANAADKAPVEKLLDSLGRLLGVTFDKSPGAIENFYVSYDPDAYINPHIGTLESDTSAQKIPFAEPDPFGGISARSAAALFPEILSRFAICGKDDFYFLGDNGEYGQMSRKDVSAELIERTGLQRSAASALTRAVVHSRRVHDVLKARAWTPAGIHSFNGTETLVCSSPKNIEPAPGNFRLVTDVLRTVFPENEMLFRFLSWLKHAYTTTRATLAADGKPAGWIPLLALVGSAGAGKDLIINTIFKPVFGGRNVAAMESFFEEKEWFGAIVGCDIVVGNDFKHLNHDERRRFGSRIKQVCNCDYRAESKGKDPVNSNAQHVLVLAANIDEGGSYADVLPEITPDNEDKILVLSLSNTAIVKKKFPAADRLKNQAAILAQLPAFLHWLENNFSVPEEMTDERYGVRGWVAPAARQAIADSSSETKEDDMLFCTLINNGYLKTEPAIYTAGEVDTAITRAQNDDDSFKHKLYHNTNNVARRLKRLCETYPDRYLTRPPKDHKKRYAFAAGGKGPDDVGSGEDFGTLKNCPDPFADLDNPADSADTDRNSADEAREAETSASCNAGANTHSTGANAYNAGANAYNAGANAHNAGANAHNAGANAHNTESSDFYEDDAARASSSASEYEYDDNDAFETEMEKCEAALSEQHNRASADNSGREPANNRTVPLDKGERARACAGRESSQTTVPLLRGSGPASFTPQIAAGRESSPHSPAQQNLQVFAPPGSNTAPHSGPITDSGGYSRRTKNLSTKETFSARATSDDNCLPD